jgi:hypothetical protein
MLTLYDFNGMTETDKANAVWDGAYLADRSENDLTIQLYAVSSFYVEVFYDPQANQIVGFRAFNTKNLLVPYLAQINLNIR